MPLAVTENVTLCPTGTPWLWGLQQLAVPIDEHISQLDVRYEFVYGNGQLLLGSNYTYEGSVTLEMRSGLGGSVYYTLNGSDPTFGHPYNLPFQLSRTAVVRAIAYSADFMQSGQAPPINITIIPTYFLSAITPGGGSISINPPGGVYTSNTTIALTARPPSPTGPLSSCSRTPTANRSSLTRRAQTLLIASIARHRWLLNQHFACFRLDTFVSIGVHPVHPKRSSTVVRPSVRASRQAG